MDSGLVSCLGAYRSVLDRLPGLDSTAAEGGQVRTGVRWVEDGEVSSSFFSGLNRSGLLIVGSLLSVTPAVLSSLVLLICVPLYLVSILFCFLSFLLMILLVIPSLIISLPLSLPPRLIAVKDSR